MGFSHGGTPDSARERREACRFERIVLSAEAMFPAAKPARRRLAWPMGRCPPRVGFAIHLIVALAAGPLTGQAPNERSEAVGELLAPHGIVEVRQSDGGSWAMARTNVFLPAGAVVRTGPASRALIRLSNDSVLRLDEQSMVQIQAPPPAARNGLIELLRGGLYFFHRDPPAVTRFRTPLVAGAIRGTEFSLAVAATGHTSLDLIDGAVTLTNEFGSADLSRGDRGWVEAGVAPIRTSRLVATNVIQWCLYYPAVLNPDELPLADEVRKAIAPSIDAYARGDLPAAAAFYSNGREPASAAERVYLAALLVSAGQVARAQALLETVAGVPASGTLPAPRLSVLAESVRRLIAAASDTPIEGPAQPGSSSSLLAESYLRQSRHDLAGALSAARAAAQLAPGFGFAWARLAEMEFGFGRTDAAERAMRRALELSPRQAQAVTMQGFLLAARHRMVDAEASFSAAIALDSALGHAWLGRGLCRMRQGRFEQGRSDLLVAAAVEPNRAILRSYLGKAFAMTGDQPHARAELALARALDSEDPTAWLYAAQLNQESSRINDAVRDLEHSMALNDNRALFRSRLLLDRDQAMRGANLATAYRDAGLTDIGARAAAQAVQADYANYSAHLFLADSYGALRDPARASLRYETAAFSELLLANLLSPAAAGVFSRDISLQEYTPLFQRDGVGLAASTEYGSGGDWAQRAFQHGIRGPVSYALDFGYRARDGVEPNTDLRELQLGATVKVQATLRDSILLQAFGSTFQSGDVRPYYRAADLSDSLRVTERQAPNALAGWHRAWSPDHHTLALIGRFHDAFHLSQSDVFIPTVLRDAGGPFEVALPAFSNFRTQRKSGFVTYAGDLQHIARVSAHALIAGAQYQDGRIATRSRTASSSAGLFTYPADDQSIRAELQRLSVYAYDQWEIWSRLWLAPGVAYDAVRFPANVDLPPISRRQTERKQLSPKLGLTWAPSPPLIIRGAFTRSVGGFSTDQSVRLEPSQVAGFNQAFRSLAPEAAAGLTPGAAFETWSLGADWKSTSGTYVGMEAQWLESSARRDVGAYAVDVNLDPVAGRETTMRESVRFLERSVLLNAHQLLSDEWSLGVRYRVSAADLNSVYRELAESPAVAAFPEARRATAALLQQIQLEARFHHASGAFGSCQALWTRQSELSIRYPGIPAREELPGDDFWQFNVWAGWRLSRRRVEVMAGLLNLTATNYRLHPVSLSADLPRERTLALRLRFSF